MSLIALPNLIPPLIKLRLLWNKYWFAWLIAAAIATIVLWQVPGGDYILFIPLPSWQLGFTRWDMA